MNQSSTTREYERRDTNPKSIVYSLVLLVSTLLGTWGFTWWLYVQSFQGTATHAPQILPFGQPPNQIVQEGPAPRLQISPSFELEMFRTKQQDLLTSYGWTDQKAGIGHIPIDQAIEQLMHRP